MGTRCRGVTLLEVLLVMALVAILSGIVLVATGGARERAREGVCLSNLRQIGLALAMYRQDYGGREYGTQDQMGIPRIMDPLLDGGYLSSDRVLQCPSATEGGSPGSGAPLLPRSVTFTRLHWPEWMTRDRPTEFPHWPTVVRRRGGEFPFFVCPWHDVYRRDRPPPPQQRLIVWRFNGQAEVVIAPRGQLRWWKL